MGKRIYSIIGILLLLIITVILGIKFFAVVMGLFAVLSFLEFFNYKYKNKEISLLKIIGLVAVLFLVFNNVFYSIPYVMTCIISLIAVIIPIIIYDNKKYSISDVIYIFGMIIFFGLSYSVIVSIYKISVVRCIYVFLVAFMCDIYMCIGNKLIGKHQIRNTDRTIEGSIFGIVMSSFIAAVIHYNLIGENIFEVIVMSFVLSIASVLGDLLFYNIKTKLRSSDFKMKVIDQFDSVIFVALFYIIIVNII